ARPDLSLYHTRKLTDSGGVFGRGHSASPLLYPDLLCAALGGCEPRFSPLPNESAGSLDKRKFVGEAALEKYAGRVVAGQIGRGDECNVLTYAEMNEVIDLRQDEQQLCFGRLYLIKLSAEVLHENIGYTAAELDRLLANDLEALVEFVVDLFGHEHPRLESFFNVSIFDHRN